MVPLLPGVVVTVNESECDSRRNDKWREIHGLKAGEQLAFSGLNGDVGEDCAISARN